MKKPSRSTKAPDSRKPVRVIVPVNDKQKLQTVAPVNISPERIKDGASTTTEVLNEILRRQSRPEPMRHWGINE